MIPLLSGLSACDGEGRGRGRADDTVAVDASATTGDTGHEPTSPVSPCVDPAPPALPPSRERTADVRLTGAWTLATGWSIAIAQIDDDGCDEVLVGSIRNSNAWVYASSPGERVSALMRPPVTAGSSALAEVATDLVVSDATEFGLDCAPGDRTLQPYSGFGTAIAHDAAADALIVSAPDSGACMQVGAFDLGALRPQYPRDASAFIRSDGVGDGGDGIAKRMGIAHPSSAAVLWLSSWEESLAGEILVFDLPLVGAPASELDARAIFRADAGDYVAHGVEWDADLDGDGWADLVLGAKYRPPMGSVAIVTDPPDGDHRVWDIAATTIQGVDYAAQFGDHVSAGDLDGDGHADLFLNAAPVVGVGRLRGLAGPIPAGVVSAATSAWTIVGVEDTERVGTSSAVADLDGDGHADLAVGARANPALNDNFGRVFLFAGPLAPGEYLETDAAVVVRSQADAGIADFFGFDLHVAQLDADGLPDLVIAAPNDVQDGLPVGSVQLLFGRSDLFP